MKRDYDAAKSLILKSFKAGLTRFARWARVRNAFQRSTHYLIPKEKPLENQGASL